MSKLCEHWYINLTILSKHPWIYQNRWHAYKPFSKDVCVYMPHIHILRWWSWFFFNLGKPMCKSCVNECLKQNQFSSVAQSCSTLQPHGLHAACQASLSITNSWSLLKLVSTALVMPSNHLILCPPLLFLPSIFPSIRVFSNESVLCIRWPKYWSFSFSITPSNEYSGLISFRMDWLDVLAVQGTLKSLLQHSSKASILRRSAFFIVPTLTSIHDYWKNHSLD